MASATTQAKQEAQPIIDASPTKELFLDILTRDIQLKDCIMDLIDNSVDAYTRNEITERREVKLQITEDIFEIYDNCGGIDKDILASKVFRFGVEKLERDSPTLGVYGIGLKRAVFKIGRYLSLETDDGNHLCKLVQ